MNSALSYTHRTVLSHSPEKRAEGFIISRTYPIWNSRVSPRELRGVTVNDIVIESLYRAQLNASRVECSKVLVCPGQLQTWSSAHAWRASAERSLGSPQRLKYTCVKCMPRCASSTSRMGERPLLPAVETDEALDLVQRPSTTYT